MLKKCKKELSLILAASLLLSLTACGGTDVPKQPDTAEATKQSDAVQGVLEQIDDIGKENADVEIGEYQFVNEAELTWEETEGGVALTGYTGTATAIEFPTQVNGMDVVEIRAGILGSVPVVGVKLPDTVKTIGDNAFAYVMTLVEIEFGNGTKTIGRAAFDACAALSRVELNEGLQVIGERAFSLCNSLKSLDLPSTLTEIRGGAFVMSSGLESITIPSSVQTIGEQAFSSCSALRSVKIENGVVSLGYGAFEYCPVLESVYIPESVTEFGGREFNSNDNLTIYTTAGSAAETYAKENGIPVKYGENFE